MEYSKEDLMEALIVKVVVSKTLKYFIDIC